MIKTIKSHPKTPAKKRCAFVAREFRVYSHTMRRGGYAYLRVGIPLDAAQDPFIAWIEYTCGHSAQDRLELRQWSARIKQSLSQIMGRPIYIFGCPHPRMFIDAAGAGIIQCRKPGVTLASFYCTPV